MWVTGVIYAHGLRGLWYTFFSAWTAIAAFVSARIFRRSLAYTQAEWQTLRFDGLGAELLRGWLAGWQVFMNMFILGWVGIAMGKVAELVFGWPVWVGLVVPGVITALDWLWTAAFLLLMVGGAFFFYRLARRSESDFFLAGRDGSGVAARSAGLHRLGRWGVSRPVVGHHARDCRDRRLRHGHEHRLVCRSAAHPVGALGA
jgi:Na+/proline symporter